MLELFLALDARGEEKALAFVSGNMCGVLLSHIQHLNQKHRTDTFINIDQHGIVALLGKHIERI